MINTAIQLDNSIMIIIVASAFTRPNPRGRGLDFRGRDQDPRGRGQDPLRPRPGPSRLKLRPQNFGLVAEATHLGLTSLLISLLPASPNKSRAMQQPAHRKSIWLCYKKSSEELQPKRGQPPPLLTLTMALIVSVFVQT